MQEITQPFTSVQRLPAHRALWWLIPTPFAWLSSILYISSFIFKVVFPVAGGMLWKFPVVADGLLAGVVLILLLVDRVEYWRYGEQTPLRMAILLLITRILLFEVAIALTYFNFSGALYLLLPYFAMIYFGEKAGYGVTLLVLGSYFLHLCWYQPAWYLNREALYLAFLFGFALVFVALTGRAILLEKAARLQEQASRVQAEDLLIEVKHSHRQLQLYAEQVATLATLEERNRLAREIHDSLGHALTAITVQLEKALVYHDKHPQEAVQAISDAKRVAKDALQDVRRSVRALRTEQEPFACGQAIALLVEQLRSNCLLVDFVVNGSEKPFSWLALMTLYRVAQEGFTNIQKHARASAVYVHLHFAEEEAHLSIRDNGEGFDAQQWLQPSRGREKSYGLQGIRERLTLIGGHFHMESQPGHGTCLAATVTRTCNPVPAHQAILLYGERAEQ